MTRKVQKQYLNRLMHTSPLVSVSMYGCCWFLAHYFLCDGSFGSKRYCHLFAECHAKNFNLQITVHGLVFFNCQQPFFCLALMSQCLISINHIRQTHSARSKKCFALRPAFLFGWLNCVAAQIRWEFHGAETNFGMQFSVDK